MAEKQKSELEEIIYVSWEESEAGWGERPDGCSLHLTKDDFSSFLKDYWNKMPDNAPHEYSRPAGNPVVAYSKPELYERIKNEKKSLRIGRREESDLVKKGQLVYGKERSGWVARE